MHHASIVAVTKPLVTGVETADDFVAYAARVSNPSNQANSETAPRLVRYLRKNKHWSPFEMVHAVMEITTTRDIARQILRHRSFSFQEFSQRYADPTQDLGFVTREARLQDLNNRQNSIDITDDEALKDEWTDRQKAVLDTIEREQLLPRVRGMGEAHRLGQAQGMDVELPTGSAMHLRGRAEDVFEGLSCLVEFGPGPVLVGACQAILPAHVVPAMDADFEGLLIGSSLEVLAHPSLFVLLALLITSQ